VRDRIKAIGFDLSKYSNDLAAIHTILKRLNESGELRFVARGGETSKHAYIWNTGPSVVALGPDIAAFMRDSMLERDAIHAHDEPPRTGLAPRARKTNRRSSR
jgi:hypothetical protein